MRRARYLPMKIGIAGLALGATGAGAAWLQLHQEAFAEEDASGSAVVSQVVAPIPARERDDDEDDDDDDDDDDEEATPVATRPAGRTRPGVATAATPPARPAAPAGQSAARKSRAS